MSLGPDATHRRRVSARPEVQALESRDVPTIIVSAPPTAGRVPPSYLLNPIPPGPLEVHIHPHLTIIIDGQPQTVPALIGYDPGRGWDPLHTHDDSGTIHVESMVPYAFTLGNFFTVWGQEFTKNDLLGHPGRVTMTVNGRPSRAFGALVLRDHTADCPQGGSGRDARPTRLISQGRRTPHRNPGKAFAPG